MWILAAFLLGLMVGIVGSVFFILWYTIPKLERLYVFRPSREVLKNPENFGIDYDQCFIKTKDGCRLSAWHFCPSEPKGSIIYFHGSTGNLGILVELLLLYYHAGLQVFAVDYRGYGWSTGVPSEEGIRRDAIAATRYFMANFRRAALPVIIWGRSIGGVAAAYAAERISPSGLILETAFADKASLVEEYPHLRFFRFFSRYKLDTVGSLKQHSFPVLIIHGDKDKTVPLKQGQILYNRLSEPKEFWRVPGAGHVDIHMIDSEKYIRRILGFVESVRPPVIH